MEYCPGDNEVSIKWTSTLYTINIDGKIQKKVFCEYCIKNCVKHKLNGLYANVTIVKCKRKCCCPKLKYHNIDKGYKCPPCQLVLNEHKDDYCIECEEEIHIGKICTPCSNIEKRCLICGKDIKNIDEYLDQIMEIVDKKFNAIKRVNFKNNPFLFYRLFQDFQLLLQKVTEMQEIFRYSNLDKVLEWSFDK